MKVKLLSDLHCEGWSFEYQYTDEDLVILAGDIHTQNRHEEIIDQIPDDVKILFVPGNHEYYSQDFDETNEFFYRLQKERENFYYLDNESIQIDDVAFFGGTMFTDFTLDDTPGKSLSIANTNIADFYHIKTEGRIWTPHDHIEQFNLFRTRLVGWLSTVPVRKRVVISHFMPSVKCSHPVYLGSNLQPYFIQNMEFYMSAVDYWFCGHGHSSADLTINGCHVIMNPRGYGNENRGVFDARHIMEI